MSWIENKIPIDINEVQKQSLEWSLKYWTQPKLKDLCSKDQTRICENNILYIQNIIKAAENNWETFTNEKIHIADVMDTINNSNYKWYSTNGWDVEDNIWPDWAYHEPEKIKDNRQKKEKNPNEWWNWINWKKYPNKFSV